MELNGVGEHDFLVPQVEEIEVDAFGAQGGSLPAAQNPGTGGLGAGATGAVLAVNPGETLQVFVGGQADDVGGPPNNPATPGGFNGGGDGGPLTNGTVHGGAGGGGASDVRRGAERLVIAGGGGGGSHGGSGGHGGEVGEPGQNSQGTGNAQGGGGATQGAGGAGGAGDGADDGETGTQFQGGAGGGDVNNIDAGGGGGGGFFGGGGGGGGTASAPGGGAGAGGGSSFGPPGTAFQTGANAGDGRVEIRYLCSAELEIVKTGSGPDPLEEGATVDYTFEVTNTGNVPLTDVTVTDPLPGISPIDCPDSTLEPGESMTCTTDYVVTSGDVDAGVIENTATVTGQPPPDTGLPPPTDESSTTVPPTPPVEDEADVTVTPELTVNEDETVDIETEVTNNGPADATGVEVIVELPECAAYASDDCGGEAGPPFTWTISDLGAGATASCTMTAEGSACEGEQTVTVEVTADQEDPNPDDNTVEAVFDIDIVPALPLVAVMLLVLLLSVGALSALRRIRTPSSRG